MALTSLLRDEELILVYQLVRIILASKVGPCHHVMARHAVADRGDGLHTAWRIAANILNKQSRKIDKEWSSSLVVGRGSHNSSP